MNEFGESGEVVGIKKKFFEVCDVVEFNDGFVVIFYVYCNVGEFGSMYVEDVWVYYFNLEFFDDG